MPSCGSNPVTPVQTLAQGVELDVPVQHWSGARAHRAVHSGPMQLAAHVHEWPSLALHLLGSYRETNELAEVQISGPAAVLHASGSFHSEEFSDSGAEVLLIHFDPAWLGQTTAHLAFDRPMIWKNGAIALQARQLAEVWIKRRQSESHLRDQTAKFLQAAFSRSGEAKGPLWHDRALLQIERGVRTPEIAAELGLHRASVARSYRKFVGEGVRQTLRRRRVEEAIGLLRRSNCSIAEVALECGFCDQSHLNRAVKALTGRTPAQIRLESR